MSRVVSRWLRRRARSALRSTFDGLAARPRVLRDAGRARVRVRADVARVVSVKAGDLRGTHILALRSAYPSGQPGQGLQRAIEFTEQTPAASLVVPLELDIHEPGVYSFDAFFDDRLLTRMSLWVGYR